MMLSMSENISNQNVSRHFAARSTRKPDLLVALTRNQLEPMLDSAIDLAVDADVAIFKLFPGTPSLAVGLSPKFMDFTLENDDLFTKPDAASVYEMLGGVGILSMSPLPDTEPYQRREARNVVNRYFTRNLKTQEFAEQLHHNILDFLQTLVETPDVAYDVLMKQQRLAYLRDLYFGDSITDDEMRIIYEYTEGVFASTLSMFIRKPLKDIRRLTWHQMTPKRLKLLQKQSEDILTRVIDQRLSSTDYGMDLFGGMIKGIVSHWEAPNQDMKLEIISGFLQILFASADTTPSAVGSLFKLLSDDQQQQQILREHAHRLVGAKDNQLIEYSDFLERGNPDSLPFHRFIGQLLVDHPPTPATARKALVDIPLSDGVVIKKGTNVFIGLSETQARSQMDATNAEELMDSRIFGGGKTKCIGRPSALYELYTTAIQILHHTDHISIANPQDVERVVGGTLRHEGMKLRIVMANQPQ